MAHSGSDADAFVTHGRRPHSVARASRRLGLALLGAAGPAVVTALLVAVTRPGTGGPLAWVGEAMATPLVGGAGLAWAFHVAAVTGLAGLWIVGFALVVEGYFGVD
ncbi:hypothetical protein I7X12_00635 [Halosimplex litoreum]|uniref:Uncharacterized protein n=1 Tax=Halosimplex litoreum TaxID=1198301 RepID=A0A7T3KVI4_9EURY|nr:hypothetical protein [Halosimplex litoreum]QPV63174.1 hypothetical protein I7X12_00635 [Halosimplex litoreum]